jgi:hypothetical protein
MFTNRRGRRVAARRIVQAACLEAMESRTLMSVTPAPTAPPPEVVDKVDNHLYQVAVDLQRGAENDWVRNGVVRVDSTNRIETYLSTLESPASMDVELRRLGVIPEYTDTDAKLIQAWVPAAALDDVARLAGVTHVDPPVYAVSNVVTSAGDGVLKADKVRAQFAAMGIDGTGIKIGVISDGADDRAAVGGELPGVTLHPTIQSWNSPGSHNEGTAMLEIVHDLAPGAQLFFAGPDTATEMTTAINWFVSQGCNIIVDDLGFFDQGYFTDTAIANAAAGAVSQGVVYVSAAGNASENAHYQALYQASQSATSGGILHRFAPGGNDAELLNIPAGASFRAFLEWSDGWSTSGNDYNLYLYNGDTFAKLDDSTNVQDGNDKPFEMVAWTNNTGSTVHAQLWVEKKNGAAVRELEFFTIGNSTLTYQTQGDAIFGQQAVPGVISVAAASAGSPDTIESYSSRGGSTIYTNFTTQTKIVRETLDGTATDGVQTKIGQLGLWPHNPFYGTSAAAPHAAAIAALIKQVNNGLTPAQVADVMAATAIDLGVAGYDTSSGAGRYNALDAVYMAYTPSAPDMTDVYDSGFSHTDNLTSNVTPNFTGTVPLGSYVRLFVDGVESAVVQLGAAVGTYSLFPGSNLSNGPHAITIRVASSASVPLAENSGTSAPLNVTIDTIAPTLANVAFSYDFPGQRLTYTFSEDVSNGLTEGATGVHNLTTNSYPTRTLSFQPGNKAVLTFPSYTYGALPDGDYHADISALTDSAGNALSTGLGFDFFVYAGDANLDRTVNFADLVALSQHYNTNGGNLWSTGDFTADGNVNFEDMVILSQHYNTTLPDPGSSIVVQPPPAQQQVVAASLLKQTNQQPVFNTQTLITRPTAAKKIKLQKPR